MDQLPVEPFVREITFPAQFTSLDEIREFVGNAAKDCGLDDNAIYAVQLAVDEACTNIIEHAYGGECQQKIQCNCLAAVDGLTITLRDCGRPFNPACVPEPDLTSALEDRQAGGLGFYFINRLMDDVHFAFDQVTGNHRCNVLTMVKRKARPE